MKTTIRELLERNLSDLESSRDWLRRSHGLCLPIRDHQEFLPEEYDVIETLTSRYARMVDLLVRKVFRSIDAFEFEVGGSLLDTVLHAEKRGLVLSSEQARLLTELRNEIVHDYAHPNLEGLFHDVMEVAPQVFDMVEKTLVYSRNLLSRMKSDTENA